MTKQRILIVEDETIVALFVEDLVMELGHEVVGVATRLSDALARLPKADFDFAILDVNLRGEEVFPFAERLREQGTPFVFATGLASQRMPEDFLGVPTLQKPFTPEQLSDAIARARAAKPQA